MPNRLEKRIVVDDTDVKSIKKAEGRKLRLENGGWRLKDTIIQLASQKTILVYEKYKAS
jgi:hypothetical protein